MNFAKSITPRKIKHYFSAKVLKMGAHLAAYREPKAHCYLFCAFNGLTLLPEKQPYSLNS